MTNQLVSGTPEVVERLIAKDAAKCAKWNAQTTRRRASELETAFFKLLKDIEVMQGQGDLENIQLRTLRSIYESQIKPTTDNIIWQMEYKYDLGAI